MTSPSSSIGPSRRRKTVEDLMALPDDVRAELIEGEIHVTPSPTPRHQEILTRLAARLLEWAEPQRRGTVFVELDVHLPSGDVVRPDVVFVAREHRGIVGERLQGVPDLLVEVVSPSHPLNDRVAKRDLYARNRVPEYWIVEPDDGAVQVLRLDGARYAPAGYFRGGSTITSASLPGLAVPVDGLFAG